MFTKNIGNSIVVQILGLWRNRTQFFKNGEGWIQLFYDKGAVSNKRNPTN